jgi:hypothetical protein
VQAPTSATWDAGSVLHILPQVSDTRMLVKASFSTPADAEKWWPIIKELGIKP